MALDPDHAERLREINAMPLPEITTLDRLKTWVSLKEHDINEVACQFPAWAGPAREVLRDLRDWIDAQETQTPAETHEPQAGAPAQSSKTGGAS